MVSKCGLSRPDNISDNHGNRKLHACYTIFAPTSDTTNFTLYYSTRSARLEAMRQAACSRRVGKTPEER